MRFGRLVSAGVLAAVASMLAGCGDVVAGTPTADQNAAAPVTTASFGDLRTVDPCALIGPDTFAQHGPSRPLGRESLDDCRFAVTLGRENVEVELGLLRAKDSLPEGGRELRALPGGASIVQLGTESENTCPLALVLGDGLTVSVVGRAQSSNTELQQNQVCAVAGTGADGVLRTARQGGVGHWEPATNSLARISACAQLPAADVAAKVGTAVDRVTLYAAEHQCLWGEAGGESPNGQLDFTLGKPKELDGDSRPEQLGGRTSIVEEAGTSSLKVCSISTEHIPYPAGTEGEVESAAVRVLVTDLAKDPCVPAREMANAVWPKLPAK